MATHKTWKIDLHIKIPVAIEDLSAEDLSRLIVELRNARTRLDALDEIVRHEATQRLAWLLKTPARRLVADEPIPKPKPKKKGKRR